MEEKKDLKETLEFIAAAKEGAKAGMAIRDIVKDGIDPSDLPAGIALIAAQAPKLGIYTEGFSGLDKIKEELADLDKEEITKLFFSLVDAVAEVERA